MAERLFDRLPASVRVEAILESRYPNHARPASWDSRVAGIDTIKTSDGKQVKLLSEGGQSPPKPGWTIVLSGGDSESGYRWTLYALSASA